MGESSERERILVANFVHSKTIFWMNERRKYKMAHALFKGDEKIPCKCNQTN